MGASFFKKAIVSASIAFSLAAAPLCATAGTLAKARDQKATPAQTATGLALLALGIGIGIKIARMPTRDNRD